MSTTDTVKVYGIYRVILLDGFTIHITAVDNESAITAVIAAGATRAPRSYFKSVTLIRAIEIRGMFPSNHGDKYGSGVLTV